MNEFKIIKAHSNPLIEIKRIGLASAGGERVFAAHRVLIEQAYERVSEISGLPKSALIPPTIITDSRSFAGSGQGWGTREAIRHSLKENADLVADSLPREYRNGLADETPINDVLRSLDDILMGKGWDNYLFNGRLPAILVMGNGKGGTEEAHDIVLQMMRGHLAALEALVNTQFWNPTKKERSVRERYVEISTMISTVACASYGMSELREALAGKGDPRMYDMLYLEGLRMEWLLRIRDLLYENCGANLAMILNFKNDLAHYELAEVEEFSTRRHLDTLHGKPVWAKKLADLLAERGMIGDAGLTERAREEVSSHVHGFFMQDMVRE